MYEGIESVKFYRLKGPDVWGNIGPVLIAGEAGDVSRSGGCLLVDRTGPFVPPIFLPSQVVIVTDQFRQRLEEEYPGVHFREVIKNRIVEIHWETWDRAAGPAERPPGSGEPHEYLYANPHSPAVANQIGELWELVLEIGARSRVIRLSGEGHGHQIDQRSWTGDAFFLIRSGRESLPVVSLPARDWLVREVPEWVSFQELRTR